MSKPIKRNKRFYLYYFITCYSLPHERKKYEELEMGDPDLVECHLVVDPTIKSENPQH